MLEDGDLVTRSLPFTDQHRAGGGLAYRGRSHGPLCAWANRAADAAWIVPVGARAHPGPAGAGPGCAPLNQLGIAALALLIASLKDVRACARLM